MKTQFTTGPWALDGVNVVAGPYVIAQTPTNSRMDQANRRLISAALDLLAACEALVAWDKAPGNEGNAPYLTDCVKAAKAAITKATGGEK